MTAARPPHGWPDQGFLPLTEERVDALPPGEQRAWRAYLAVSAERARRLPPMVAADEARLGPTSAPPTGGLHTKGLPGADSPAEWYASAAAQAIADRVVAQQSPAGGWTKGLDYTQPGRGGAAADVWSRGTFDNEATSAELRFLARVIPANAPQRTRAWRQAFLRGLDYVLDAQYPNGGFPQVYPLAGGYHDAITYNDAAMLRALSLLQDVAARAPGYEFVSEDRRSEAARRLRRGIDCILATQIRTAGGRRTAWCQQHDALTGAPCAARNFEPVAVCTAESAAICLFLMALPDAPPAVTSALDDAVAWLSGVALREVVWRRTNRDGNGLTATPGAPLLWSRLYEIGTDRPIFGDRDRTVHYSVTEISPERRLGYQWYGAWPQDVISARP